MRLATRRLTGGRGSARRRPGRSRRDRAAVPPRPGARSRARAPEPGTPRAPGRGRSGRRPRRSSGSIPGPWSRTVSSPWRSSTSTGCPAAPLRRVGRVPDRALEPHRDAADRRRLELRLDVDAGRARSSTELSTSSSSATGSGWASSIRERSSRSPTSSVSSSAWKRISSSMRAPRARGSRRAGGPRRSCAGSSAACGARARRPRRAGLRRSESSSALSIELKLVARRRARRGHRGWRCARSGLGSPSRARRSRSAGSRGHRRAGDPARARRARCRRSRSPPGARRPGRVCGRPRRAAGDLHPPPVHELVGEDPDVGSSSVASEKNGPRVPAATAAAPCDGSVTSASRRWKMRPPWSTTCTYGRRAERRGGHLEAERALVEDGDALGALKRLVDRLEQLRADERVREERDEGDRAGDRDRRGERQARKAHARAGRTRPANGVDQPRLAVLLELAAQVADVDLERVRARAEVVVPDAVEDHRAGQHLPGLRRNSSSSRNLGLVSSILREPRRTSRAGVHRQVGEAERAASVLEVRRSRARSRACSSSSANGLTR